MIVTLQSERVQTLADVRAVIDGNHRLDYQFTDREAAYEFIRRTLVRFDYPTLSKPDKGVIGRYLAKMTGLSRAQMTRLVGQHRTTGRVTDRRRGAPVRPFERRYTGADIRLLAEVDAALGDMSGPATRAVMRREFEVFDQRREPGRRQRRGATLLPPREAHLLHVRMARAVQRVHARPSQLRSELPLETRCGQDGVLDILRQTGKLGLELLGQFDHPTHRQNMCL